MMETSERAMTEDEHAAVNCLIAQAVKLADEDCGAHGYGKNYTNTWNRRYYYHMDQLKKRLYSGKDVFKNG